MSEDASAPEIDVSVTAEDITAARLTGATGAELVEAAIHTALDRYGIPREGRTITVADGEVIIGLPGD